MSISNYLSTNPDFWISAKQPILTPSVGSGDKSPVNLIDSSDIEVSQSTSSAQPTWEDGYWSFDGSDDVWKGSKEFDITQDFDAVFLIVAPSFARSGAGSDHILKINQFGDGHPHNGIQTDSNNSGDSLLKANLRELNSGANISSSITVDNTSKSFVFAARLSRDGDLGKVRGVYRTDSQFKTDSNSGTYKPLEKVKLIVGGRGDNSSGQSYSGDLNEAMFFWDTHINDPQLDRLVQYVANKHGITNQKTSFSGIRIHNEYPANPDVHIEADKEVQDRSDGDGVQRPLNLPADSDLEPSQGTDSNQPIWRPNNGEPYYEFGGDDIWDIDPTSFKPEGAFLIFVVGKSDVSKFNQIFKCLDSSGGGFQFRSNGQYDNWEVKSDRSDGTTINFITIGNTLIKSAMVMYHESNGDRLELYTSNSNNGNSEVLDIGADFTDINIDTVKVGGDWDGPIWTIGVAKMIKSVSQTKLRNFRDYLAQKHGIA